MLFEIPTICFHYVNVSVLIQISLRPVFFSQLLFYLFYFILFIQYNKRVTHLAVIAILPCGPLCKHIYICTNTKVI